MLIRVAVTLLVLLSCGCVPSAPEPSPEGDSMPAPAVTAEPGPAAQGGEMAKGPALTPAQAKEVVAYLDGTPVTAGRLLLFGNQMVAKVHHSMGKMQQETVKTPLDYLPSYVTFFAVLREATANKMDKSNDVALGLKVRRLLPISLAYRRHLIDNAKIPPEQIKATIPSQWTKMNFRLFVFESMEDAEAARKGLKGPGDLPDEKTKGFVYIAGKAAPETGMVFPGSGFFDEFDDPYLFTLKEGELSRPVQSGVGAALVLVLTRKDYTPEEQAAALKDARQNLAQTYGVGQVNREAAAFPVHIIPDAVRSALREQVPEPAYASTQAVARVGSLGISLPLFFQEAKINLATLTNMFSPAQWAGQIELELKGFCEDVAVGLAAEKAGFKVGSPLWAPEVDEFYRDKLTYQVWQRTAWRTAKVSVSESEARAFYESEKDRYQLADLVTVRYYFTPDGKELEALSKRAEEGIAFESLGKGLERRMKATPHGGGEPGLAMKEKVIVRGSQDFLPMQEALFAMEKGDTQVLDVDMGYYLFHVEDRQKGRQRTFEEARPEIESRLEVGKRFQEMNRRMKALSDAVKVQMAGEGTPPTVVPEKGRPDQG